MIKMANNKLTYFITIVIILLILNSCKSINYMKYASSSYNSGKYSLSYFFVKKQLKKDSNDINAIKLKSLIEEEEHDYLTAKETYKKILLLEYESPTIFNNYGNLLYKSGNLYGAMHYLNKAYTIDSNLIFLNFNLAVIYFEEFDSLKIALSYIDRELINNKDDVQSLLLKGDILLEIKDFKQAMKIAYQALQIDSTLPKAYIILGRTRFLLEDYKNALKFFSIAISLNKENASYFLRRGSTYALLEDYEAALKDFSHAISIDKNYIEAYESRIRINSMIGNNKQIYRDIKRIEKLDNQSKNLYDYNQYDRKLL